MSITAETITAILNEFRVPAELHADPELQAVAYGVAFLGAPATKTEENFYDSDTVFYDVDPESDSPLRYEVGNRDLMAEQLFYRASVRTNALLDGDAEDETEHVGLR
ncbi:hypothetical protein ACIQTW_20350 [Paenarthrobacter sp. NPDC090517]|uniref:hypothetical protein n=1 Tax=Paenarthrobacter sp. NPDC090517 TaxID=3364381 RepID=UPI003828025E